MLFALKRIGTVAALVVGAVLLLEHGAALTSLLSWDVLDGTFEWVAPPVILVAVGWLWVAGLGSGAKATDDLGRGPTTGWYG